MQLYGKMIEDGDKIMANAPYIVISDISMVETTVNKSRFVAVAFPVQNMDQVKECLASIKKSNKGAAHIPYAYLLGENFDTARNSDDGEPSGSAGAPIYQAIKERNLTNVLVAVVRFFGGVELGKARLSRVFYSAASNALMNAKKSKMVYCGIFEMIVSYSDYAALGKVLTEKGFPIIEKNYNESLPMIKCAIPADTAEKVIGDIRSKMKDSAKITKIANEYYRFAHV